MSFSNTYDTTSPGSAALNREEIESAVALLAPSSTPVYSMAEKLKIRATFHEWGIDKLADVNTTSVAEGSDVTSFTNKFADLARVGNYVHTLRREFMETNIQKAVDSGDASTYAKAELKAIKELKRDIEATILGTQDRAAENGGGTAYTMRGLGDWLDSTGPSDVPAAYRTPSGSIHASGAMSEVAFNGLITSVYRTSGEAADLTLVADTALRTVITAYTQADTTTGAIRTYNANSGDGTIKLFVKQYMADNGSVSIVNMNPVTSPDTTNKDVGYLINPDYLKVGELIPMGTNSLPNLGGGERGFVDWTGTLIVNHPAAHGEIVGL